MIIFIIFILFFSACGQQMEVPFQSITALQPQVVSIEPLSKNLIHPNESITIHFSQNINPDSILQNGILLMNGTLENDDADAFFDQLEDGIWQMVTFKFEYLVQDKTLTIQFNDTTAPKSCSLIITPKLLSDKGIPFNQSPGQTPKLYVSNYNFALQNNQDSNSTIQPDIAATPLPTITPQPLFPRPSKVVINELFYDADGSDTIGILFIELYGTPNSDLSKYKLVLLNGEDNKQYDEIIIPENSIIPNDGLFVIADASPGDETKTLVENFNMIENFDPQNGPDGMQLLNENDLIIDTLGYGNLNASFNQLFESTPAKSVLAGHSLSRINGIDTNNNSIDFVELNTPSPHTM